MISIESLNANDLPSYGPRARVSFITRREKSPACWRLIELVCRFARAVEDFGDLLGVAAIMKRAPLMERPVAVWLLGKPVPLISPSQVEDRLPPSSTYIRVEARSDKGVIYDVYFDGSVEEVLRRFAVLEIMLL